MKNKSGIWWSNCISSIIIFVLAIAITIKFYKDFNHWSAFVIPFVFLYFIYDNQVDKTPNKEDRFIFKNKLTKFL